MMQHYSHLRLDCVYNFLFDLDLNEYFFVPNQTENCKHDRKQETKIPSSECNSYAIKY